MRGGIGEAIAKVSFINRPGVYIGRFFHDISYFILIVILLLELVFGIIVETFRELRIEANHHEQDKKEVCFVCGIEIAELQHQKKSFVEHLDKTHNLWNYVNYMIRLKFSDPQDLNAVNSYVLDLMDKKNITWFPIYEKGRMSKEEQDHNAELEIEREMKEEYIENEIDPRLTLMIR
jgi:inositol 1,4,5-triphosphate receptor type 1